MLKRFRRHTQACEAAYASGPKVTTDAGKVLSKRPQDWAECSCPIHCMGTLGGRFDRRSLATHNWTRAAKLVLELEAGNTWDTTEKPVRTITECVELFLSTITDKARTTQRGIRSALLATDAAYKAKAKARDTHPALAEWAKAQGIMTIDRLTFVDLVEYLRGMACSANHKHKRIQLLRRLFKFAIACGWVEKNPALDLEYPDSDVKMKQPFADSDVKACVAKAEEIFGLETKALVLTLRWAGFRISDAAKLNISHIRGGMIHVDEMQKTGRPVSVPVHPELRAALAQIQPNEAGFYFWSGKSKVTTVTDNNRVRLTRIFEEVGMAEAHPHRFRHTFAVDLLRKGAPLEFVSRALGHSSIKVTEKHYGNAGSLMTEQLASVLMAAWGVGTPAPTPIQPRASKRGRKGNVVTMGEGVAA